MTVYSGIANNTFSYLLTLDAFRGAMRKDLTPSWIKITTITMISSFIHEIDIAKLRNGFENIGSLKLRMEGSSGEGFEWNLKPTTFYNQITLVYVDKYSTKSVKVFPNGSIQVAGCSDLFDCKRIITQLSYIFKMFLNFEKIIPIDTFRVVMINSNFSLNYNINLVEVSRHFESRPQLFKVSFEPDRYSAVKIKFKPSEEMKEITTSIFSTGKIIITGAETLKEIAYAYNIINAHLNTNDRIRVTPTVEKDHFGVFMGHKIEGLIEDVKQKGFKSWISTEQNMRINF